jgi:hypothetical protein
MDIRAWLEELGLGQYAENFEKHQVTAETVDQLTSEDLKQMWIASRKDRKKILEAIPRADELVTPQTRQERIRFKEELGRLGKRKFKKMHKNAPEGEPEYPSGVMLTSLILFLIPPLFIIAEIIFRIQQKNDAGYFVETGRRYRKTALFWINFALSVFWSLAIYFAILGGMIALAFLL